jgi:hypothetical protein
MDTPTSELPSSVDPIIGQLLSDYQKDTQQGREDLAKAQAMPVGSVPTIQAAQQQQQEIDKADPFTSLPPVDHINELMSQAPLLIGLTALGGSVMGVPAQAMLASTNGMVSGLVKGDQQAYQDEKEKYQSEYNRWAKKHGELWNIFQSLQDAYKASLGEKQGAIKAAEATIRLAKTEGTDAIKFLSYLQKGKDLEVRQRALEERLGKQDENNLLKAMGQMPKVVQGYSRLSSAIQYTNRMSALLPTLIDKYKAKTGSTVVPDSVGKLLTAISDDPAVGEYVQLSKDLKAALVGVEMPQGTRGNMFIQKIISETAPNLWTMSAAQLQAQMAGAVTLLNETRTSQKKLIDGFQSIIDKHGGPDMTPGEAEYKTPNPEIPNQSAAPKEGDKGTSKSGKPMHFDGTRWVYD